MESIINGIKSCAETFLTAEKIGQIIQIITTQSIKDEKQFKEAEQDLRGILTEDEIQQLFAKLQEREHAQSEGGKRSETNALGYAQDRGSNKITIEGSAVAVGHDAKVINVPKEKTEEGSDLWEPLIKADLSPDYATKIIRALKKTPYEILTRKDFKYVNDKMKKELEKVLPEGVQRNKFMDFVEKMIAEQKKSGSVV